MRTGRVTDSPLLRILGGGGELSKGHTDAIDAVLQREQQPVTREGRNACASVEGPLDKAPG